METGGRGPPAAAWDAGTPLRLPDRLAEAIAAPDDVAGPTGHPAPRAGGRSEDLGVQKLHLSQVNLGEAKHNSKNSAEMEQAAQ